MLNKIFNPKSVALIGASNKKKSVGSGLANNLIKSNTKVYFINPNRNKILNEKCFDSILDIKKNIDLVIIAIPAKIILESVKQCIEKKVKGVIIISDGFSEVGNYELENEIKTLLEQANIPLIGPNCLGILNPKKKLNASFAPFNPKAGNIGFVSQSGAIIDAVIDLSMHENYGFSKIISIGNGADLDLSDYLKYLEQDVETKVIMVYLEGIKKGRKFIKEAQKIKKPIIVLKAGKSNVGKKATLTHTGSLAGDEKIYDAVFEKTKIIQVESIQELLDTAKAFSFLGKCKNGLGVVTNGGGLGVLSADYAEKYGILMPRLKENVEKLNSNNPLDLIGNALSDRYEKGIEVFLKQQDINILLVIQGYQIMTEKEENAKIIKKLQKKYNKPIVCSFVGGDSFFQASKIVEESNIPNYSDPKRAIKSISNLIHYEK